MKRKMKTTLSLVLCAALILSLGMIAGAAKYTPGEYTASAPGFGGDVSVTVTVDEDSITNVEIVGDGETPNIGGEAIKAFPQMILDAQGENVDGVSGATYTSKAVRTALADALTAAAGSEVTVGEVKMAPGTYDGTGRGFSVVDPVQVKVTVTEDAITDIYVENYWENTRETPPIMQSVIDYMVPSMIEYQTVTLDAVSGATASSNGVKTAVEAALKEALAAGGSDESAIRNFYVNIPKKDTTETIDVDVLIVGMGGSGCAAAVSTAEHAKAEGLDLNILAIDKAGKFGGTSANCGEPMAINPPKYKEEFNNGEDYMDKESMRNAWLTYTDGDAKTEMLDLFLDNSGDTLDWLYYDHGFEFTNAMSGFSATDTWLCKFQYAYYFNAEEGREYRQDVTEGTRADTVNKYFQGFIKDYTDLGGKYQLNTEAYELLTDESGAVCGVKARNTLDGTEYVIHAKAVIMACGGFVGSEKMELKYLKDDYYPIKGVWRVYGLAQNDGTLMEYAIENLDAATYNIGMPPMVHFKTLPHPLEGDYELRDDGAMTSRAYAFLRKNPMTSYGGIVQNLALNDDTLWVNMDGNRFCNENGTFEFWKSGPKYYSIWGADQIANVAENGFSSSMYCIVDTKGAYPAGVACPDIYSAIDDAVAQGLAFKGETIEDLATQMGVPAENLAAAISKYNDACTAGVDEEFGKKQERLISLGDNGPYYCFIAESAAYSTCAGLDVDTQLRVLNTSGEPINGLYAVGNDCGGVLYTEKKAYVTYGGGALGWAFTSGRLAGQDAVAYVSAK